MFCITVSQVKLKIHLAKDGMRCQSTDSCRESNKGIHGIVSASASASRDQRGASTGAGTGTEDDTTGRGSRTSRHFRYGSAPPCITS